MPDTWENQYGLNPNNPNDATGDRDSDGATNLEEYQAGTDPTDPNSVLRLALVSLTPVVLEFVAETNRGYTVEYQSILNPAGVWQVLIAVAGSPARRVVQVPDNTAGSSRFYRVRTP